MTTMTTDDLRADDLRADDLTTAYYIGYDDEENSLIRRLLKKDDLNECYRILFQLVDHKKKECVWDFIIRLFLDFYAELNPKLEHFIFKLKTEKSSSPSAPILLTFAYIIKNMFIRKSTSRNVYNARVGVLTYKYTLPGLKHKKNTHVDLLINEPGNNKYAVLLNALHSKNIDKIAYKISAHLNDGDKVDNVHRIIIRYFSRVYFSHVISRTQQQSEEDTSARSTAADTSATSAATDEPNIKIFEKWLHVKKNITPEFYFHYLIAIVIHLFAQEKDINESILFVRPNPDILILV